MRVGEAEKGFWWEVTVAAGFCRCRLRRRLSEVQSATTRVGFMYKAVEAYRSITRATRIAAMAANFNQQ
jgi:hypothetical protein